ncbi:hypothetical protein ABC356_005164 [Salmonella enterica]|uniref:Uncharacterized protein n=1 Tax=Salmonella enterica subsp. salamae serovar 30:1,z28:z6 TaxID=1967615 RepID=A0A737Y4N2_SALER|nr:MULTISPECIES: hypothetical protein [Enterobacterales]EBR3852143.1 hypothetical protein [Salmonella enterica subsp. enterica]ECD5829563.1 hypothetical protein [Salmonella enterica subsp. enterica serovar Newport]ECJ2702496.1 hypothetical protein [Salmonella enterica subsp. diarizonae]ECN6097239.1 hypothetical protein [Salmonella enterica subsp. enterica serovar Muenchen]EDB0276754.1 hypothetical protein [Salmonella enterica subsp. enterica serovar Mbandaka]EDQ7380729.1 hypothetical protein 
MNNEQDEIKREANVHSWLYGVGITGVVSGMSYIFTPGEIPTRLIVSALIFLVLLFPIVKVVFYFISSGLRCKTCNASYSIKLIDTKREFLSAIPRSKTQNQGVVGGDTRGPHHGKQVIIKSNWTEERYNITNIYSCIKCGNTYDTQRMETRKQGYSSTKFYR